MDLQLCTQCSLQKTRSLSGHLLLCMFLSNDFNGCFVFSASHCMSTIVNFWCRDVKWMSSFPAVLLTSNFYHFGQMTRLLLLLWIYSLPWNTLIHTFCRLPCAIPPSYITFTDTVFQQHTYHSLQWTPKSVA